MKSAPSRKQFLTSTAAGIFGCLINPVASFAAAPAEETGNEGNNSSVLLRYRDKRYPALQISIIDPDNGNSPTLDPESIEIREYSNILDKATCTGETICEFNIKETESDRLRLDKSQGIAPFSSTTNESSDTVAAVKVKATWSLSADKKKINLTKVNVTFDQKKGTVTGRNILIVNDGKQYKNSNIGLSYSYSPTWGYRDYHDLKRETNHFVNVWATAEATGMGGKRELSCMLIYGS